MAPAECLWSVTGSAGTVNQGDGDVDDTAYFSQVAASYDRLQPILAGPAYEAGMAAVLDLVPHGPGEAFRFVDLACGTATLTCQLLERFPHAEGVGIDGEPAMLEIARRKLAPFGRRAELREGDLTDCGLLCCDVVVSAFAFHHVSPDSMPDTLQRVACALGAGGCFILLDQFVYGPGWGEGIKEQTRRIRRDHSAAALQAGRATQEEVDARWEFKRRMKEAGRDVEYWHSVQDLCRAMLEAGFAEAGLLWCMHTVAVLMGFTSQ